MSPRRLCDNRQKNFYNAHRKKNFVICKRHLRSRVSFVGKPRITFAIYVGMNGISDALKSNGALTTPLFKLTTIHPIILQRLSSDVLDNPIAPIGTRRRKFKKTQPSFHDPMLRPSLESYCRIRIRPPSLSMVSNVQCLHSMSTLSHFVYVRIECALGSE